ncbi:hypothetical protein SG34_031635 [Thalassomonas viridans]|uniref:Porin n=1 Tax=Thalassomonas viridans TaxID=137584 RepID=A0AAE9ZCX6_9GAMM|nr:hypothetical protein [Thalassomonas viridans]WDE08477.1 hypothetical protein SG34_031635 [Thalassomonas viridans]
MNKSTDMNKEAVIGIFKLPGFVCLTLALTGFSHAHGKQADTSEFSQSGPMAEMTSEAASTADEWLDDWGDEITETSPWHFSGFAEAGYGEFTRDNVTQKQESLAELRAKLEVNYTNESFTFNSETDVLFDEVTGQTEFNTRELNFTFSASENTDIVAGRQVITWGKGDYLFLNDLFAKDWQSFFAGRDDAYLKAANDAIRVMHYVGSTSIDLVYSPEFTADDYINGERFSFYSPANMANIAPNSFAVATTKGAQTALRLATTHRGVEYAFYGYRGFWTQPVGVQNRGADAGKFYFPRLNSYGASIRTPLAGGLFNAELAVYNSTEDSKGDKPLIANGQIRLLLGYEQELARELTAAVQFYLEHTKHHHELAKNAVYPHSLVDENRQVLTLRLTQLLLRQQLTASLFTFYSPTDQDVYLKSSLSYRYNDHWQLSGGANLFWGKNNHTFFGQHKDNSNLWLRVRYNY